MKIFALFILFTITSEASKLNLNQSVLDISDTPTRLDCNSVVVVGDELNQCCIGNSCQSLTTIELNQPGLTACPRVVIDNYVYELNGPLDIHHDLLLFVAQSNSLTNCRNGNDNDPTLGTGFLAVMGIETIGVQSSFIDVDAWTLIINSIDGDVICDGGTIYENPDIIFVNSFD